MQAKQWLAAKVAKKHTSDVTADEELLQLVPRGRPGSHEQASSSSPGPVARQSSSMVHAVVSQGCGPLSGAACAELVLAFTHLRRSSPTKLPLSSGAGVYPRDALLRLLRGRRGRAEVGAAA